mmetsp:Transcript_8430/g.19853  ORF Transcript_8430/g.19853 Transcript_8430/m.19853 type:complete len:159 (-) Transcript_8430:269-745(-)
MVSLLVLPAWGFVATPAVIRAPTVPLAATAVCVDGGVLSNVQAWLPTIIVGIAVQQYAFKANGIFVSKKQSPSGLFATDKARLEDFGWLQADQRMPLPRAEELHLGRRSPIGKIDQRQVYLSAHNEDLHETGEGDIVEGCVVSADFSEHYGTDMYVCI